ncbi:MAG: hypothetical protein ACK4HF_15740 [Paracoccaceae bacterium]
MTEKTTKTPVNNVPLRAVDVREARLKAALKANMARRKAQAKQRGAEKNFPDAGSGAQPDAGSGTEEQPGSGAGTEKE